MDSKTTIVAICDAFKNKEFGIEEFQSRIEMVILADEPNISFEKVKMKALNRLEEIRFCCLEADFQNYGDEVATTLIKEIINTTTQ